MWERGWRRQGESSSTGDGIDLTLYCTDPSGSDPVG